MELVRLFNFQKQLETHFKIVCDLFVQWLKKLDTDDLQGMSNALQISSV